MTATGTEGRICADIAKRQQLGIKKYGVTVEKSDLTLRQWLQHSYDEKLDDIVYMKRAMEQMDRALDDHK